MVRADYAPVSTTPGANWVTSKNATQLIYNTGWFVKVGYGNGKYIAVQASGDSKTFVSSDKGLTWSAGGSLPSVANWSPPVYGNSAWVTVAPSSGSVAYSTNDGGTWTLASGAVLSGSSWYTVAFGSGQFVAISNTTVASSTDGINWTGTAGLVTSSSNWLVAYGGGIFATLLTGGTSGTNVVRWSTPPNASTTTWTTLTLGNSVGTWKGLSYGNGMWLAVSDGTTSAPFFYNAASNTMTVGVVRAFPATSNATAMAFGSGRFVVARGTGSSDCYTSEDGSNWTARPLPLSASWNHLAAGPDGFLMVNGNTGFPNVALSFATDVLA
jgi:hypothetical protein